MRHLLIGGLWLTLCFSAFHGFSAFQGLQAADPAPDAPGIGKFELLPTGAGLYRPEKWGLAQVNLRNPQSKAIDVLTSTHFVGDQTLQYGRRVWMPARSIMNSWLPMKMPKLTVNDQKFFELRTLLMTYENGVETLTKNELGAMQFDQSFQIAGDKAVTAAIVRENMETSQKSLWANSMDLLMTARYERGLSTNLVAMNKPRIAPLLPATEEAWDVVEQLVIADDRILNDSAGIKSIRRWVVGGGSLWIMADQVSPELMEKLLGDEAAVTVVDKIDLTHVALMKANESQGNPDYERDLDQPTPFVRVIADDVEPVFYLDGWLAAFVKPYGEGRVLVTTLGPDGWLRARTENDRPSNSGVNHQTVFYGSEPLNYLAGLFFVPRSVVPFKRDVAEDLVRQTIGYSIPSRSIILGTLLGFTLVMGLSAAWLSRSGRLEWLGAATPIAAIIAGGFLISTGIRSRSEVSDTTSVMQYVQAVPGTDDVRMTGVAGIFNSGGETKESLAGKEGGMMLPALDGLDGVTRRLVWSDIDKWSWENMTQKPGLRTVQTQSSGAAARELVAEARIEETGLSGHVLLPEGMQLTDAILATSTGRVGLTTTSDGHWTTSGDAELLRGQYLAANILSDEQQRRVRILTDVLAAQPNKRIPAIPTLYAWTKPWDTGFTYGLDTSTTGSSLVAIPVTWVPGEDGKACTLPRSLLSYQEVTGPDGFRPSGFFDLRSNEWQERSGESTSWVAFELPREIMPVTLKSADLTFKVKGAMGHLKISGFKDDKVQVIHEWDNPVGTLTYKIEDASLIPLDANGRFIIRVDAGTSNADAFKDSEQPVSPESVPATTSSAGIVNYWQFEDISAGIQVVTPPSQSAAPDSQ